MANVCDRNYSDTTFYKNQSIIGIEQAVSIDSAYNIPY